MSNTLSLFESIELVFTNDIQTEVLTDTLIVARELGVKHYEVLKVARKLIEKEYISQLQYQLRDYINRGKKYPKYDLTIDGARRLIMSLGGDKAERFKTMFNDAFSEQGRFLSTNKEWLESRCESKTLTKSGNNAIERLVDYARANGSENHKRYYTIFQRQINQVVLGVDHINRDTLPKSYITIITLLEDMISQIITARMRVKVDYHDIAKESLNTIREVGELEMSRRSMEKYIDTQPTQQSLF